MGYSNTFVSLFKIAGCFIRNILIAEKEVVIEVYRRRKTGVCPQCGKRTKHIHLRRIRKILHEMIGIQRIYLQLTCRTFFCPICKKRFAEYIPFLEGKKRRTTNLTASIISRLRKESFRSTTEAVGVSYHGLRDCLITMVNPFLPNWSCDQQKPFSLGIDEHYARKNRYVLSITNLTERKPITFLPTDSVWALKQFINRIPPEIKEKIKETCCDIHDGYIKAVETELPNSSIVIDHFHMIQDANRRINQSRLIEQEMIKSRLKWKVFTKNDEDLNPAERRALQAYCLRFPILHCFWKVKEDLRSMYRLQTRDEAEKMLKEIRLRMEKMDVIELKLWSRSLRRHEKYILNFFNNRTTNAYTEGIHVKCKLTQRISFGFRNIEVYIRKAMLAFLPLTIVLNHHRF